jgi:hypothetical protein
VHGTEAEEGEKHDLKGQEPLKSMMRSCAKLVNRLNEQGEDQLGSL